MLDQFEELLAQPRSSTGVKRLVADLGELLLADEPLVHVVLGLREEFLGELTALDGSLPELLGNYYRLDYLGEVAAGDVIEGTAANGGRDVDPRGKDLLIRDLLELEFAASSGLGRVREPGSNGRVMPPVLQVVCHAWWNKREEHGGRFLESYRAGDARATLEDWFGGLLAALTRRERETAAACLSYLVGRHGAKIAVQGEQLARALHVSRQSLDATLDRLSTRSIVRVTRDLLGERWYELYHDTYGALARDWRAKTEYERRLWWQRLGWRVAAAIVLLGASAGYWFMGPQPETARQVIAEARLEDPASFERGHEAFLLLRERAAFRTEASRLWADAWRQRARRAEEGGRVDEAFLSSLVSVAYRPRGDPRIEVAIPANLEGVERTYRHDGAGVIDAALSVDEESVITVDERGDALVWEAGSGRLLGRTLRLRAALEAERDSRASASSVKRLQVLTVGRHPEGAYSLAYGLSETDQDANLVVWRCDDGRIFERLQLARSDLAKTGRAVVAVSVDGMYVATTGPGSSRLWRVTRGLEPVYFVKRGLTRLRERVDAVAFLQVGQDQVALVTGGATRDIWVWKIWSGRQARVGKAPAPITAVVSGASSGRFVVVTDDDRAQLWTLAGPRGRTFQVPAGSVVGLRKDGPEIIGVTETGAVVWNGFDGQRMEASDWKSAGVKVFALLRDGQRALGRVHGVVRLIRLPGQHPEPLPLDGGEAVAVWSKRLGLCFDRKGRPVSTGRPGADDECLAFPGSADVSR